MPLVHLIYASTATSVVDRDRLEDVLRVSRANNAAVGVTGMLLHTAGSFFQVLEGEAPAVDATFARIQADDRHSRATIVIRERIARRAFGEWSMGCATPEPDEVAQAAGMNDFFDGATCFDRLDAGRAKKLLAAFRDGRWRARVGA